MSSRPAQQEDIVRSFTGCQKAIYCYCLSQLHHKEAAEDATSETIRKALTTSSPCKGSQPALIRAWLFTIAKATCIDALRKKRELSVDLLLTRADGDGMEYKVQPMLRIDGIDERLVSQVAIRDALITALRTLPKKRRDALIMRHVDCLSFQEIATILCTHPGTLKTSIYRDGRALRERISPTVLD